MSPLAAGAGAEGVWESAFSRSPPCDLFTGSETLGTSLQRGRLTLLYTSLSGPCGREAETPEKLPASNCERCVPAGLYFFLKEIRPFSDIPELILYTRENRYDNNNDYKKIIVVLVLVEKSLLKIRHWY